MEHYRNARQPRSVCAINCNPSFHADCYAVSNDLSSLLKESLAPNTLRAYRADLADSHDRGLQTPADPVSVAEHLIVLSKEFAFATLRRRAASIGKLHRSRGYYDPTHSEIVRATLRGLSRRHGIAQKQAKALSIEDLSAISRSMENRDIDIRDRAILLLGFAGAFRRSELASINIDDLRDVAQGLIIDLRRSKTDQQARGRQIPIPVAKTKAICPVEATHRWIETLAASTGPLFRRMDKYGNVKSERLSGQAISLIMKLRLARAGIDPEGYSAHSLRAGYITAAINSGVPIHTIKKVSGHRSPSTLLRYARSASLFDGLPTTDIIGSANAR